MNGEHANVVTNEDILPGDCVSTDQSECRIKCRIPHSWGKDDQYKIYCGTKVFVIMC